MYGTLFQGDPTTVLDATPRMTPGALVRTVDGKTYKYVKFIAESVAAVAGAPAFWSDTDSTYSDTFVTADYSECMTDTPNDARGIFVSVPVAATPWCFIQTWGYNSAVVNDGTDLSIGVLLVASGDGVCTVYTLTGNSQTPYRTVGYVAEATSATSGKVMLTLER